LLPVVAHNLRAGELVLVSSNGGINYFIGNHAGASGAYEPIEGVQFFQSGMPHDGGSIAEASRRAGRPLSAAAASNFWLREALRWQLAHPAEALSLLGRKFVYALADYEIPQIENFDWARRESALLRVSPIRAGVLIPLGLAGIFLAARGRPRSRPLVYALAAYWLALAAFFVTARFRAAGMPLLFGFSAFALVEIVGAMRAHAMRRAAATSISVVLLSWLAFQVAPAGVRESSQQLLAYSRGVTAMQRNEFAAAAREFALAARQNPEHAPSWANLGYCQEQLGQNAAAVASYSASLRVGPGDPRVLELLSQLLLRDGEFAAAQTRLLELTAIQPDNWLAWASLGDLAMQAGELEAMRSHWQRVLDGSDDPELTAMARQRLGQP
jgi:tetratricopeptide (TPR) repeat protein